MWSNKFDEAVQFLNDTKSTLIYIDEGEHELMFKALIDLSNIAEFRGKHKESITHLSEAKELVLMDSSNYNMEMNYILNQLGNLNSEIGQFEKAEHYYQEALSYSSRFLPENDWRHFVSVENLAQLKSKTNQIDEARILFEKAMKLARPNNEHPEIISDLLLKQANLELAAGNLQQALQINDEASTYTESYLGKNHVYYARCLNNRALIFEKLGKFEKAIELVIQSNEIDKDSLGEEHYTYAVGLNNLSHLYSQIGEYEKAVPISTQALYIISETVGEDHELYLTVLNNLSLLYTRLDELDKAETFGVLALNKIENLHGKDHPQYARFSNNLAALYALKGDIKKGLSYAYEAERSVISSLGKEHELYGHLLNIKSVLLELDENHIEATSSYLEVMNSIKITAAACIPIQQ